MIQLRPNFVVIQPYHDPIFFSFLNSTQSFYNCCDYLIYKVLQLPGAQMYCIVLCKCTIQLLPLCALTKAAFLFLGFYIIKVAFIDILLTN